MERGLVVAADGTESQTLGKQAGEFAAALSAELHVVRFVDQSEYQDHLEQAATGSRELDSIQEVKKNARELAQTFADDTLEGLDVEVHVEGVVDDMPEAVVQYAEEQACDHIFVTGQKRSPAGKVLFGDTAQSVILNFDGPITVITE